MTRPDKFFDMRLVDGVALGLKIRAVIPVDSQPLQRLEDGIHGSLGRTGRIGVFNPENKFALHVSGIKPVEKRGPGAAHMQITGGSRWKAGDDRMHIVTF